MSKPREFWTVLKSGFVQKLREMFGYVNECRLYTYEPKINEGYAKIHVIEKLAYDQAIKERDSYKAKAEKLTEAFKILKVAVNDKVSDPGATAFIERTIKEHGVSE